MVSKCVLISMRFYITPILVSRVILYFSQCHPEDLKESFSLTACFSILEVLKFTYLLSLQRALSLFAWDVGL